MLCVGSEWHCRLTFSDSHDCFVTDDVDDDDVIRKWIKLKVRVEYETTIIASVCAIFYVYSYFVLLNNRPTDGWKKKEDNLSHDKFKNEQIR